MDDLFRLDNRVAVVVGGAGGIGAAMGQGLALYGAKVVITDVNSAAAEEIADAIKSVNTPNLNILASVSSRILHKRQPGGCLTFDGGYVKM